METETIDLSKSQSLIDIRTRLERLKAQRDMISDEIDKDTAILKEKYGIEDIEQALASIGGLEAQAKKHLQDRDQAIAKAQSIMDEFPG